MYVNSRPLIKSNYAPSYSHFLIRGTLMSGLIILSYFGLIRMDLEQFKANYCAIVCRTSTRDIQGEANESLVLN